MADFRMAQSTADGCLLSPFSPLIAASTLSDDTVSAITTIRRPRSMSSPAIAFLSPRYDMTDIHLSLIKPSDGIAFFDLQSVDELTTSLRGINLNLNLYPVSTLTSAENSAPQSAASPSTVYLTPMTSMSPDSVYVTPYSSLRTHGEVQKEPAPAPQGGDKTPMPSARRSWAQVAASSASSAKPTKKQPTKGKNTNQGALNRK